MRPSESQRQEARALLRRANVTTVHDDDIDDLLMSSEDSGDAAETESQAGLTAADASLPLVAAAGSRSREDLDSGTFPVSPSTVGASPGPRRMVHSIFPGHGCAHRCSGAGLPAAIDTPSRAPTIAALRRSRRLGSVLRL